MDVAGEPGDLPGPGFQYVLLQAGDEYYVMAEALAASAMQAAGMTEYTIVGKFLGADLEYMKTAHLPAKGNRW